MECYSTPYGANESCSKRGHRYSVASQDPGQTQQRCFQLFLAGGTLRAWLFDPLLTMLWISRPETPLSQQTASSNTKNSYKAEQLTPMDGSRGCKGREVKRMLISDHTAAAMANM
jgi:hypothetical protein